MFWNKKYEDFVDTSLGRIFIKPLTNEIHNTALIRSNLGNKIYSSAAYIDFCEKQMTCIRYRKWKKLTFKDNDLISAKVQEILTEAGQINVEKIEEKAEEEQALDEADLFSDADKDILNAQKEGMKKKYPFLK